MTKEKILPYTTSTVNCIQPGAVKVDRYCNGFTVINIGAVVATVNGVPLSPPAAGETLGDSLNEGGNKGEIFTGRIDIQFAGAGGQVLVIQKTYIPNYAISLENELNASNC